MQDTQSRMLVRPVFAAFVFGLLAVLFLALAVLIVFATHGNSSEVFTGVSLLAPCVPLVYFATRGFAHGRRSAFQDMPERACGLAALVFLAGVLVACASGVFALAVGPGIAAVLFALCVESVRNLVAAFP
jgi:hypothetical protein